MFRKSKRKIELFRLVFKVQKVIVDRVLCSASHIQIYDARWAVLQESFLTYGSRPKFGSPSHLEWVVKPY